MTCVLPYRPKPGGITSATAKRKAAAADDEAAATTLPGTTATPATAT